MKRVRLACLLAGTLLGAGCGRAPQRDVVLVTLDTFRADRLEAYGGPADTTPRLNRFAELSTRFADVTAPTPITLPSHATILTGRYPTRTGVRNNGSFVLADAETTLAEVLRGAGWSTSAVVGAYPLHARFGLSQGFQTYDDAFPEATPGADRSLPIFFNERRATEVTDRALAAWARMAGSRRFLWVHYFDAHAPYDAPEPYASSHAGAPYDGEVAYVDAEVGRLLDRIRAEAPGAIIVITADHGESLGEHGEKTHGIFVYQATVRVPLLISAPDLLAPGQSIDAPVSLADVMPTILDLLGLEPPSKMDGASLVAIARSGEEPSRPVYTESYLPRLQFRFSELTALRRGALKYIEAPLPELYDLATDPGELANLAAIHPDRGDLAERLADVTRAADTSLSSRAAGGLDREAEARLRSLGYAAAGTLEPVAGEGRGRDPKTMTAYLQRYDRAVGLNASSRMDEGIAILKELIPDAPENFMAHYQLAVALLASGRLAEAAAELDRVVEIAPEFSNGHLMRAEVQAQRGEIDAALRSYEAAAATSPGLAEPRYAMGQLLESLGRFEPAGEAYGEALRLEPDDREIAKRLVDLRAGRGEIDRAVEELRTIAAAAPRAAGVRAALATALRRRGDPAAAFEAAADALRVDPSSVDALVISGELLLDAGRPAEAQERFTLAERLDPDRPDVQLGLTSCLFSHDQVIEAEARLAALLERFPRYAAAYRVRGAYLERIGNREGAIAAYRQALSLQPADRGARAGLARLQGR